MHAGGYQSLGWLMNQSRGQYEYMCHGMGLENVGHWNFYRLYNELFLRWDKISE